jgi:hypothetical protein
LRLRSFKIHDNVLSIIEARNDREAREAHQRVAAARQALEEPFRTTHRSGRFVYWWIDPPSRSERSLFALCVRL